MAEWFYKGIFWVMAGGCFLIPPKAWGQGTMIIPFGGVKEMGPAHSTPPLPYEKNYIMLPMTSGKLMRSDGGQQIIVQKPVQLHSRRKTVIPLDQIQGQVSPTPVVPRGFNGGNVTHYSSAIPTSAAPSCPVPTFTTNPTAISPSESAPPLSPAPVYTAPETTPTVPLPAPAEEPSILVPAEATIPAEATTEMPAYEPSVTSDVTSDVTSETTQESTVISPSPELPENPSEKISTPDPYLPMNFSPPSPSPMVPENTDVFPTTPENTWDEVSSPREEMPSLSENLSVPMENTPPETEIPIVSSEQPVLEAQKKELPPTMEQTPANKRGGNSMYNTPAISTYRENGEILTRRANIMDYYQNVTPIQVPKQSGPVRMGVSPSPTPTTPLPNALPGGKPASSPVSPGSSQAGRKV